MKNIIIQNDTIFKTMENNYKNKVMNLESLINDAQKKINKNKDKFIQLNKKLSKEFEDKTKLFEKKLIKEYKGKYKNQIIKNEKILKEKIFKQEEKEFLFDVGKEIKKLKQSSEFNLVKNQNQKVKKNLFQDILYLIDTISNNQQK